MTDKYQKAREALDFVQRYLEYPHYSYIADIIDAGEKAERERDQLRERVGELEECKKELILIRNGLYHEPPNACWSTGPLTGNVVEDLIACPGCRALEACDRLEAALRPLPEPHESAPGTELEPVGEAVAPATEPGPADVAPPETKPGVGADVPGDTSEH